MTREEAVIVWGLARGNLALACAAGALWKLREDTPAGRIQYRRVFGQLLPDLAPHVEAGDTPRQSKARTDAVATAQVDAHETRRIARFMALRHLPVNEIVRRWDDKTEDGR